MTALEELKQLEEVAALEAAMKKTTPQQKASKAVSAGKNAIGFALQSGKQLAGGLYKGLATLARANPLLGPIPLMLATGGKPNAMNELFAPPENEAPEEALWRKTLEGGGQALMSPVGGVSLGVQGLAGMTGGLGAEVGRRYGKTLGGVGEAAGEVAGGILGGGLTGFTLGPKQSIGQADIRRELAGVPDSQWNEARNNVDLFTNSGSTTATLADAFPGKPRIAALAGKASNMKGGELLAQRLASREDDLQNLGQETLRRMGPEVDENTVANAAGGAANSRMLFAKEQISNEVGRKLAGIQVSDKDVFDIFTSLKQFAASQDRGTVRKAYEEVAEALLSPEKNPITNLQELSYAIRDLKGGLKNPLVTPPGTEIIKGQAIAAADRAMRNRFPAYKNAMEDFAKETQAVRVPMKEGPIGSLADRNPMLAGQTSVTKLEGLLKGNSPATIKNTLSELGSPILTNGNPVNAGQIAQALAQKKLANGSTNPGQTVRGAPGMLNDRRFNALIEAGGGDAPSITAPLRAADQLQNLNAAGSVGGFPEMRSGQAVIRPFRTLDMMMTGKTERDTQREISRLLADPTPAGLARLREIAMFDPNLRRQLTLISAIRPGLFGTTSQEQ